MAVHVLTGAGSGIGAALARRLADRGDHLVLLARSAARGEVLRSELPGADVVVADLADHRAVERLHGWPDRVDSVVHAAGTVRLAPVERLRPGDLVDQLAVNLVGPAALTTRLLPALRATRGTVVFVNSTAGLAAHADWSAYAASKAGLRAFADSLRLEEAAHGVRVTTVFPGRTATPMQERVHTQEGAEYDAGRWIRPETVAEAIVRVLDLPRDATVPEVVLRPGPRG